MALLQREVRGRLASFSPTRPSACHQPCLRPAGVSGDVGDVRRGVLRTYVGPGALQDKTVVTAWGVGAAHLATRGCEFFFVRTTCKHASLLHVEFLCLTPFNSDAHNRFLHTIAQAD